MCCSFVPSFLSLPTHTTSVLRAACRRPTTFFTEFFLLLLPSFLLCFSRLQRRAQSFGTPTLSLMLARTDNPLCFRISVLPSFLGRSRMAPRLAGLRFFFGSFWFFFGAQQQCAACVTRGARALRSDTVASHAIATANNANRNRGNRKRCE